MCDHFQAFFLYIYTPTIKSLIYCRHFRIHKLEPFIVLKELIIPVYQYINCILQITDGLISKGVNPNDRLSTGDLAVCVAARKNYLQLLQTLIKGKTNLCVSKHTFRSALLSVLKILS